MKNLSAKKAMTLPSSGEGVHHQDAARWRLSRCAWANSFIDEANLNSYALRLRRVTSQPTDRATRSRSPSAQCPAASVRVEKTSTSMAHRSEGTAKSNLMFRRPTARRCCQTSPVTPRLTSASPTNTSAWDSAGPPAIREPTASLCRRTKGR